MFVEAMNSGGSGGKTKHFLCSDSTYNYQGQDFTKDIDCTSISDYPNMTVADFIVETTSLLISMFTGSQWESCTVSSFGKTYNPNTGILTLSFSPRNGQFTIGFDVYYLAGSGSSGGGQGITIPQLTLNSSFRDTTASSYANQSIPFDVSGYSLLTIDRLTIKDIINAGGGSVSIIADDSTTLYSGQAVGGTSVDISNLSYDISAYSVVKFNLTINRYAECRTNITNIQIS